MVVLNTLTSYPFHPFSVTENMVQGGRTTATSPFGFFMSRSNQMGSGSGGPVPSHTSRYFSADFGLIHFAGIDLNAYATL